MSDPHRDADNTADTILFTIGVAILVYCWIFGGGA